MTFGQRLKSILDYYGLKQKFLADETGYSENKISRIIKDQQDVVIKDVIEFSKVLNVTCDQLLGKDEIFDEMLRTIVNLEKDLNLPIFALQKILHSKRIFLIKDKHFFDIINVDIYSGSISYLDTVNCVKVRKTQEEMDKELAQLREMFPDARSYLLEENKRVPQVKKVKLKDFGKTWRYEN